MIDLYGVVSPNVQKVAIMLEETGLAYRLRHVAIFSGAQFEPAFEALSPNHKVPVIVDQDGPGGTPATVFESGAILIYLAEKARWGLSADPIARSTELQWLMLQMSSFGPMIGQYVHFLRYAPPGSDYALDRYTSQVRDLFAVIDRRLGAAPYLGGDAYSIADISVLPCVRGAILFFPWFADGGEAALAAAHPSIGRWYRELSARPAFDRAVASLDALRAQDEAVLAACGEEDWDRFLKRGRYAVAG
ncbi:glutathione S-transferase family protein [Flavisphingomonas formosensis]|uniref:glutathione S-transferase family protein n=1 Tax=Flavisphingomonas formosensis TaxID=861534 RepID=UPI0012FAFE86|nr:glutathione S-transferase N-terminal domain-containing protein [Sphingomonas formosensis]